MGRIRSQSIKSVAIAYLGIIIGFVTKLLLFTRFLEEEEIGLITVLEDITSIFVIVAQLGIATVIVRYFPYFQDDKKQHNGILFFGFVVGIIGFLFTTVLFFLFRPSVVSQYIDRSPLLIHYLLFVLPLAMSLLGFKIMEAYSRSLKQIVVPNFIRDVLFRLGIALVILLFGFEFIGLDGIVNGYVLLYAGLFVLMVAYYQYKGQLYIRPVKSVFRHSMLGEMINYGLFVILGSSANIIQNKMDTLMLASLKDLGDTGIYSIAFLISNIIEMPRRALGQISVPFVTQAWKDNDLAAIENLYKKTALNQMVIGALAFIGIWANIDNLFRFMPNGEVFAAGKYVVLFVGLGRLFDMSMGINTEIIVTSKYYKWNVPLVFVLIALTFITNYILIPLYGLTGAALATLISIICYNIIRFLFLWAKFKMQPFSKNTWKGILIALFTFGINFFLPVLENPIVDLIYRSIIICIVYGVPTYLLKVSPDVNKLVIQLLSRFIGKR